MDVELQGKGRLSTYGKRLVARSMYQKGQNFVAAAILLDQRKGYRYVVLHLLAQGIEIMLKGLLLLRDYDRYQPRLKKSFGHNLQKIAEVASQDFGLQPPGERTGVASELEQLDRLYRSHLLRYGSGLDILLPPESIPVSRLFRRVAAVMRLSRRYIDRESAIPSSSQVESAAGQ